MLPRTLTLLLLAASLICAIGAMQMRPESRMPAYTAEVPTVQAYAYRAKDGSIVTGDAHSILKPPGESLGSIRASQWTRYTPPPFLPDWPALTYVSGVNISTELRPGVPSDEVPGVQNALSAALVEHASTQRMGRFFDGRGQPVTVEGWTSLPYYRLLLWRAVLVVAALLFLLRAVLRMARRARPHFIMRSSSRRMAANS